MAEVGEYIPGPVSVQGVTLPSGKDILVVAPTMEEALDMLHEFAEWYIEYLAKMDAPGH